MVVVFGGFIWGLWNALQPGVPNSTSPSSDSAFAVTSEISANEFVLSKADGYSDFVVQLTPIEELEVGRRVRADAATDEDDLSLGQRIDPATWKKLTFTAVSDKGTTADIVLLRPDEWVEQQQAEVGSTIYLVVPEVMNADALIHSIEPCPEIIDGPGQVVTGTFRHECADNVELIIEGESEPIRCTASHPFWSEDRQDYLPAASFVAGEQLLTASGVARVLEVKDLPGTVPVFNLEVHVKHVYHVGRSGLLVHNTYGKSRPRFSKRWKARDIADPAYQTGCEDAARQIQQHVGGEIKVILPKDGAPGLGGYRGHQPWWSSHEVVVNNGRVYDAFTGYEGLPIDDWKQLWEYPDAIDFGFRE